VPLQCPLRSPLHFGACCALVLRSCAAPLCCALVLRSCAALLCCALVLRLLVSCQMRWPLLIRHAAGRRYVCTVPLGAFCSLGRAALLCCALVLRLLVSCQIRWPLLIRHAAGRHHVCTVPSGAFCSFECAALTDHGRQHTCCTVQPARIMCAEYPREPAKDELYSWACYHKYVPSLPAHPSTSYACQACLPHACACARRVCGSDLVPRVCAKPAWLSLALVQDVTKFASRLLLWPLRLIPLDALCATLYAELPVMHWA